MKALLVTRCGASRLVDIAEPAPLEVRVPLRATAHRWPIEAPLPSLADLAMGPDVRRFVRIGAAVMPSIAHDSIHVYEEAQP